MDKSIKNIYLKYFVRSLVDGLKKRWFGHCDDRNSGLSRSFSAATIQFLERTGFPIHHYHEGNQHGETFGARIANAFEEIFNKGYDAVVAVGNDSPGLQKVDFEQVTHELAVGNCVLGPSLRGGTYLIGLTKSSFRKLQFEGLPWQSRHLFTSLNKIIVHAKNNVVRLAALRDINSFHDVLAQIKKGDIVGWLLRFLIFLIDYLHLRCITSPPLTVTPILEKNQLRGPPYLP